LPPNQLVSLRKKLNIKEEVFTGPTDDKIRNYMQSHSLNFLIYKVMDA